MSIEYMRKILQESNNIVCLLGRVMAEINGCDYYKEEFDYEVEEKYGYSVEEIFTTHFFNNRSKQFYQFYREEILKKQGNMDEALTMLRKLQDDKKLLGVVTRGFFDRCSRVGIENVVALYGNINQNRCPACGKEFDSRYILDHPPLPYCDECKNLLHPGVVLKGEMLDNHKITRAADLIGRADTLLVLGQNLDSELGSMVRYFQGSKVVVVNTVAHHSDIQADCVCIGNPSEIFTKVYP